MEQAELYDRILGSLATGCIGDALGAPTEQRSIDEIRSTWGGRVERFYAPPDDAPYGRGRRAGQITDDSSQMLYLVDAYIEHHGLLTPAAVAEALLRWADNPEYFPRFAGPSTRASVDRLRAGEDPTHTGRIGRLTKEGTSNGAAIRVAPAGLANPGDPEAAVQDALVTCLPSHATNLAISGAACVAAALGIFLAAGGDPFLTVVGGANIGDDTDTVACIAGSIAGAMRGFGAVPNDLYAQVLEANDLDLKGRAAALADVVTVRATA